VSESTKKIESFFEKDVHVTDMLDFYMNRIDSLIKDYAPGRPEMKPDVIKRIAEIDQQRKIDEERMIAANSSNYSSAVITINGQKQVLNIEQLVSLLQQQQNHINNLTKLLEGKDIEIKILTNKQLYKSNKEK
jgi:hypothetical protein